MNVRFLNSSEKKKLFEGLERFGVKKLNYLFIEAGKEKIRAFSGGLTREELVELGNLLRVELIGLYCAKKETFGLRIGFDMLHLLKEQISDSLIELDDDEFEMWIKGRSIDKSVAQGVYAVKHGDDLLGCGYSNGSRLINFVPKERQAKN